MAWRLATLAALTLLLTGCGPDLLSAEPPPGTLPNRASVLVDDGRCPAGQVSKVTGPTSLTGTRSYACVAKPGGGLF